MEIKSGDIDIIQKALDMDNALVSLAFDDRSVHPFKSAQDLLGWAKSIITDKGE